MAIVEFKNLGAVVLAAGLVAGCVSTKTAELEFVDPVVAGMAAKDPNPFAEYGPAMQSSKEYPLTVNWQDAHKAEVAEATKPATLAKFLESDYTASKLLSEVKEAYKSDPLVMIQIASLSQMVMCPRCPKAPKNRAKWTAALLAAAKDAPDAYRKMFFLDQLRWCGHANEADAVRKIGKASKTKAVQEFAEQVAREISR